MGVQKVDSSGAKDVKKDKKRKEFLIKEAMYRDKDGNVVTAVNGDNLLVAVPVPIKDGDKIVYAGYNVRRHLPLKKGDFASMTTYILYQAYICRIKAAILIKAAEEKEGKAKRIAQFGDEATRKKATRVARMREQLKALESQLTEEGVDITDI